MIQVTNKVELIKAVWDYGNYTILEPGHQGDWALGLKEAEDLVERVLDRAEVAVNLDPPEPPVPHGQVQFQGLLSDFWGRRRLAGWLTEHLPGDHLTEVLVQAARVRLDQLRPSVYELERIAGSN